MDVYYNKNDSKYYLIGIKQSDVKFEAGKSVIDEEAYTRILQQEKMLQEGQGRADLEKLGYEFRLSEQDILERLQKKLSISLQKAQEYR